MPEKPQMAEIAPEIGSDAAVLNSRAKKVLGEINKLPRWDDDFADRALDVTHRAVIAAGGLPEADGSDRLYIPDGVVFLGAGVSRQGETAGQPVALVQFEDKDSGELSLIHKIPVTKFREQVQNRPNSANLVPIAVKNDMVRRYSEHVSMSEQGTSPLPSEARTDPAELNRRAVDVLRRITPETHLTEIRHIMAEAVARADGRTDEDGALLLPPDTDIEEVYEESVEGAEPRVMVAVRESGSDTVQEVPVAEFRARYQDPYDDSDLRPYREIYGHITARTDDAPYGPRSVYGDGTDLPPVTRHRWAELGGERPWQRPGLQTAFDHLILEEVDPMMGAVVYGDPEQRGELRELLDILEPAERQEVVDGAMTELDEDYLNWQNRTPTETLDDFPRTFDELGAIADWNPEFRRGLREGLANLPDDARRLIEGLTGAELDYSQTPPVLRSRHNGQRLNPWNIVQMLRQEARRAEEGEPLTVETVDEIVDSAFRFAWNQSHERRLQAADERLLEPPPPIRPIFAGQQLIQRDSGLTFNVVGVGDRGDGKVLVELRSTDGSGATVSKSYDDLEEQLSTEGAAWRRPEEDQS